MECFVSRNPSSNPLEGCNEDGSNLVGHMRQAHFSYQNKIFSKAVDCGVDCGEPKCCGPVYP